MKKTVSMLLVLTLVMSLSVAVFAADTVKENGGTATTNVTGTYKGKNESPVYSVDITWEDMSFTYNPAYKGEWDPSEHTYSNSSEAGWTGEGTITITNHSNADITAVPSYKAAAGFEDASMNFNTNSLKVTSADNKQGENGAGKAVTGTITVIPTGELPEDTSNAIIGTITITIS